MFERFLLWFGLVIFATSSFALEQKKDTGSDRQTTGDKKKRVNNENGLLFFLESAMANNKDILIAQSELKISHENYNLAVASFKPTVEANVGYDIGHDNRWNSTFVPAEENSGYPKGTNMAKMRDTSERSSVKKAGVIAKYNIFRGGADNGALEETNAAIKAQWSEYEALKQKVLCSVTTVYLEICAKQEEIKHIKSLLDVRVDGMKMVTEKYNSGEEKYVSVMQAKAACAETEAQLAKAEAEDKALRAQLKELTGVLVPLHLIAPEKLFNTDMKEPQAIDLALRQNPQIVASTDKLRAAKEAVRKPNSSMCPSIDLIYKYDQSVDSAHKKGSNLDPRRHRGNAVGISMTIPMYDGGVGRAKKRQAVENVVKVANERKKAIEETKAGVVKVWSEKQAAQQNLDSTKTAIEARQLALHDTEEEYKAGIKVMNDVLEAQQKLFEAQFANVQAQKNYYVSQCNALALIGKMTPKDLKLKAQEFDYREHSEKTKEKVV
ncbi:MAG: TolC family protein [Holosporales bacterium]|jgi:outer membrane protein|nr:TolC family protein [Holosporales bacterium]